MPDDSSLPNVFEGELPLFEQHGRPNGYTTWSARAFAGYLGYKSFDAFKLALNKAQNVLISLNITVTDHFQQEEVPLGNGKTQQDIRLTRFACYLAAMNSDTRKRRVAEAQAYFARFNEECQRYIDDCEQIERVLIRNELSDHEKTLSSTAQKAGVTDYALFQNAGYRGLYNLNLSELRQRKAIPKRRSPLDFMGKDELAANLFRLTQTEAKIRHEHIRGQNALENTAEKVGKMVRETMHQISGQRPEKLPAQEDIREVHKGLKDASRILKFTSAAELRDLPQDGEYLASPED
ncbi:MAG: hypothetical protein QM796_07925 [Chthoniobacteraceae bacterium]